MRTFVISDIHGQFRALQDVLSKAKFDPSEDVLYVLGDMIDWGKRSLAVVIFLRQLQINYPNNIFISKGNHECLCVSSLKYNNMYATACWLSNSGADMYYKLLDINKVELANLLDWLDTLPVYFETDDYYLTHSCPIPATCNDINIDEDLLQIHKDLVDHIAYAIWERVIPEKLNLDNKILISGHTQTIRYSGKSKVFIDKGHNYINIDCNAKALGMKKYDSRLCLLEIPSYVAYYSELI